MQIIDKETEKTPPHTPADYKLYNKYLGVQLTASQIQINYGVFDLSNLML